MAGKETPRQKMISMMYLVFIAMLAMQIDQEIIRSYYDTKESLEETRILTQDKNKIFEKTLYQKSKNSPDVFSTAYRDYLELKKKVDQLAGKIELAKVEMSKFAEFKHTSHANEEESFDFKALNNVDASTFYFFTKVDETRPSKPAQEIVMGINSMREYIVSKYSSDIRMKQVVGRVKKSLVTDPSHGSKKSWLVAKFYNQPLIAALANLEVIEAELRNVESDVLANLLQEKIDANIKFNMFEAIVSAPDVVVQGEVAQAKVSIGNYSSSVPNLEIKGVDRIENGQGIKRLSTDHIGTYSFLGEISFTDAEGKVIKLPYNHPYRVIAGSNEVAFESGALLSADKMQVLYRGLANPVSGSILGADNSQTTLSASGASVSKVGGGKWNVTPGAGNSVKLTLSGKGPKGQVITQSFDFRIKNVPPPVGQIRGESVVNLPASSIPNQVVTVAMPDFDFPVSFSVNSFMFKVPGRGGITVNGNSLNSVSPLIKNLRSGDIVYVYNINATATGLGSQSIKKIPPIVINVQ
ncbi:MAG: gliding motility protein GldM [Bergeyella sp.]|nr:gliding motility protein GldM [Bergeyella sp.]